MAADVGGNGQDIRHILDILSPQDLEGPAEDIAYAQQTVSEIADSDPGRLGSIADTLGEAGLRLTQAQQAWLKAGNLLAGYLDKLGYQTDIDAAEDPNGDLPQGTVIYTNYQDFFAHSASYDPDCDYEGYDPLPSKTLEKKATPEYAVYQGILRRIAERLPEAADDLGAISNAGAELLGEANIESLYHLTEPVPALIFTGLAKRWLVRGSLRLPRSEKDFLLDAVERLMNVDGRSNEHLKRQGAATLEILGPCGCVDHEGTAKVNQVIEDLDLFQGPRARLGVTRGSQQPYSLYLLDWSRIFDPVHYRTHERALNALGINSDNFTIGDKAFINSSEAAGLFEAAAELSGKKSMMAGSDRLDPQLSDKLLVFQHEYAHTQIGHNAGLPAPFCWAIDEMAADAVTDLGRSSCYSDLSFLRRGLVDQGLEDSTLTRILTSPTEEMLLGLSRMLGLGMMVDIATCPAENNKGGLSGHFRTHLGDFYQITDRAIRAYRQRSGSNSSGIPI